MNGVAASSSGAIDADVELVATLTKTRKKEHPEHDLGAVQAMNLSQVHDLADEEGL